jgi:hypothetical protein
MPTSEHEVEGVLDRVADLGAIVRIGICIVRLAVIAEHVTWRQR